MLRTQPATSPSSTVPRHTSTCDKKLPLPTQHPAHQPACPHPLLQTHSPHQILHTTSHHHLKTASAGRCHCRTRIRCRCCGLHPHARSLHPSCRPFPPPFRVVSSSLPTHSKELWAIPRTPRMQIQAQTLRIPKVRVGVHGCELQRSAGAAPHANECKNQGISNPNFWNRRALGQWAIPRTLTGVHACHCSQTASVLSLPRFRVVAQPNPRSLTPSLVSLCLCGCFSPCLCPPPFYSCTLLSLPQLSSLSLSLSRSLSLSLYIYIYSTVRE
jgi:hypothetical protein